MTSELPEALLGKGTALWRPSHRARGVVAPRAQRSPPAPGPSGSSRKPNNANGRSTRVKLTPPASPLRCSVFTITDVSISEAAKAKGDESEEASSDEKILEQKIIELGDKMNKLAFQMDAPAPAAWATLEQEQPADDTQAQATLRRSVGIAK